MPLDQPVLLKHIPTPPWGEPKDRKTLWYDDYLEVGGYETLGKVLEMSPEDCVDEVKKSELRGRGGAGFPAGVKWGFLPPLDGEPRYLTVNADESEPATFKDQMLMQFDPHLILEGIAITMHACQIDTAFFYIRGEYHHHRVTFGQAIEEAYAKGLFGENARMGQINGRDPQLILHRGAGAYICGEETGLIESLEGKRGWPRIKPPFPAVSGAFGRPTVINNIETLANIPKIFEYGTEWFQSLGKGRAPDAPPKVPASFGTKLFGISGPVQRPGVYEENLGVSMKTMIEDYAGGLAPGKRYKSAFPGGLSMGVLGTDEYEAELDFDVGKRHNILGLGTACITVIPEDVSMISMARNCARFFSHESCGQCTPCREGTSWLFKMLSRIEQGDGTTKDLDMLLELGSSMGAMPGTTICGLADGANWSVRTIVNKFWDEFEAAVSKERYVSLAVVDAA